MSARLYRTERNAVLGGVCQGLADYFRVNVLWVRIYFFLLTLATGLGVLIYFALWVILPREDWLPAEGSSSLPQPDEFRDRFRLIGEEIRNFVSSQNPHILTYLGIGMILLGLFALFELFFSNWWAAFLKAILWPVLLITAGVVILLRAVRGDK